jgi:hypothetical protein
MGCWRTWNQVLHDSIQCLQPQGGPCLLPWIHRAYRALSSGLSTDSPTPSRRLTATLQRVFPTWAERGITVFAFDQRGFGRTALDDEKSQDSAYGKTSWDEQMGDVDWAVKYAKDELAGGRPVFLMGHSMVPSHPHELIWS